MSQAGEAEQGQQGQLLHPGRQAGYLVSSVQWREQGQIESLSVLGRHYYNEAIA